MASYTLAVLQKHDLEKYQEYIQQAFVALEGMDFEVFVGEDVDTLEGTVPGSSVVMMKFPDNETAMRWYHSAGYQKAIPLRQAAADTAFVAHFTDQT